MTNYNFKIPEELLERLKEKAKKRASSVSQEIRTAIIEYMKNES